MTLNMPNIFKQENLYSADGRLLSETDTEGAGRNKTEIIRDMSANNGSETGYTVPAGKNLFITSAEATGSSVTNGTGEVKLRINPEGSTRELIFFKLRGDGNYPATTASHAVTYIVPLKLEATRTVLISSGDATTWGAGSITGWIEDA